MALTEYGNGGSNGLIMPVQPMYGGGFGGGMGGGFGLGGDWAWILLLLVLGGGWGGFGGFGGGAGAMMGAGMMGMDFLYPWLSNSEHISDGFRDAQLSDNVTSVRDGISALSTQLCGCCGDMQMSLANGFNGVNSSINNAQNAIAQQLYTNQLADLERSFNAQNASNQNFNSLQSQLAQCCCDNRMATADLKYTVATENCEDRYQAAQNTRDIIDSQNRSTQAILDKLCALELDNVKTQLAQAQRENVGLQNAVNMATMQASQVAQTAQIRAGQNDAVTALVNELRSCPIPSQPVYGSQPIFTCPNNNNNNGGCGCGCGSF